MMKIGHLSVNFNIKYCIKQKFGVVVAKGHLQYILRALKYYRRVLSKIMITVEISYVC